jgi:hypothetical protein
VRAYNAVSVKITEEKQPQYIDEANRHIITQWILANVAGTRRRASLDAEVAWIQAAVYCEPGDFRRHSLLLCRCVRNYCHVYSWWGGRGETPAISSISKRFILRRLFPVTGRLSCRSQQMVHIGTDSRGRLYNIYRSFPWAPLERVSSSELKRIASSELERVTSSGHESPRSSQL